MAEPSDIEVTRTVEYRNGVAFQLNEIEGKLKPLCGSSASYTGKSAQIEDRFDDLVVREKTERLGDTVNTDIGVERRFIHKPRPQNVAPLIDRDDMMTTPLDLKAPISRQTAKSIRRAQDDRFLQGFYGTAYTGETGATAVAFKSANILPVDAGEAGPKGLTKGKLILLRELITSTSLIDLEDVMPIIPVTAKQVTDLLRINEVTSRDYNPQVTQALQNGKVADFLGFRFMPTELGNARVYPHSYTLTVDGSNYRRLPVIIPAGMHWGSWEEFFGKISERADKEHAWQIFAETCGTATRTNEDLAFQMLCSEADNR